MSILDTVGKIAGAVAAVEALEKVDSDAGLLEKGAAAIAGYEGAGALENMLEKKKEEPSENSADNADTADGADQST